MIRHFYAVFDALFPREDKSIRQFGWLFVATIGFVLVESIVQTIRWVRYRWRK